MAFNATTIITKAFYLANVLSSAAGENPSSTQLQAGLQNLNQILDSLLIEPTFSSFQTFTTYENLTTREIWIGSSLSGSPPDNVTYIQEVPFMVINSANCFLNTGSNPVQYPLMIYSWNDLSKRYYVPTQAIPKYLYYTTIYDSTLGIYNKLLLDPGPPDTAVNLNITAMREYDNIAGLGTDIRPTFSLYLQYELAAELATEYGTDNQWSAKKEKRREDLYNLLISNAPLDFGINSLTDAFNKQRTILVTPTSG